MSWGDEKILIPPDSDEYQIIGDSMEDRHGLIATSEFVNEFRYINNFFKVVEVKTMQYFANKNLYHNMNIESHMVKR